MLALSLLLLAQAAAEPPPPRQSPPPRPPARSLFRVDPLLDGAVIAAGTVGVAIPYALSRQLITPRCPCDPGEVNALDRHVIGNANTFLDSLSDGTVGVAVLAPLALDALDLGATTPLLEDASVYAEVLAVNGALVTLAKYTVQRPLPRVYADPTLPLAHSPGGYRSFYSGHTSLTVSALATTAWVLQERHGARVWPWVLAGATGLMVGGERVAAGRHFYSDVAVGFLAGAAVGTVVPWLHLRPRGEGGPARLSVAAAPDGLSLALRIP